MIRIRYVKNSVTGQLNSKNLFNVKENTFSVELDPTTLSFVIRENSVGILVDTGNAKTLASLKLKAKKALQQHGVEFNTETRVHAESTI